MYVLWMPSCMNMSVSTSQIHFYSLVTSGSFCCAFLHSGVTVLTCMFLELESGNTYADLNIVCKKGTVCSLFNRAYL